jgi:hypothetical protein
MKVGIIGYGWVGRAAHLLFPNAAIHDINIEQYQDPLPECDIVFLAVPTPWDGEHLDCSAVEAAIAACSSSLIVIRSATQPGFADAMAEKYNKRIVVQPEYLGESPNHPMLAMKERQFMILGGDPQDRRRVIDCYATVYNANVTIRQVTNLEAEIIKLTENRAVFWKVLQCQELYDACEAAGVDYYTIRDAVYGDDPRMNLWWTFVYPDNRGANSKCLPKDVYAWAAWAESTGIDPRATCDLLQYNRSLVNPARKMHILADGGLGNRVAGLIGGLITAERLGLDPVISWPANIWAGCYLEDLFDVTAWTHNRLGIRDLVVSDSDRIFLLHENQTRVPVATELRHSESSEDIIALSDQDVVFYTARVPEHLPQDAVLDQIRNWRLNKDVSAAIKQFIHKHNIDQSVTGIHMRKTDNYNINEDYWFDYVRDRPEQRFFVCSDEQATEQRFLELPNVIVHEKTHYVEKLQDGPWRQDALTDPDGRVFPNNVNRGRESVIQAWIDLHILSWTSMASTTKKSSFAQLARWIAESRRRP